jgi:hypothetical protein
VGPKIEDIHRKFFENRLGPARLIERAEAMIAKADLLHGVYYTGTCRNATVARWNAEDQRFYHWRTKFADRFVETIRHPDDEAQFDVFVPEAILDVGRANSETAFPEIPLSVEWKCR